MLYAFLPEQLWLDVTGGSLIGPVDTSPLVRFSGARSESISGTAYRGKSTWHFSWMLAQGLASCFAILNALRIELDADRDAGKWPVVAGKAS